MRNLLAARPRFHRIGSVVVLACGAALLAACASPEPKAMVAPKKQRSKEYFSETEFGVRASPRVSNLRSRLPRGGGREQVGQPYKVRGKWYYPKEDKGYRKTGTASWYGDAFHGRLTANGEIYDMTHLTAAHPTMPLPSYARVTNTENGSSVIVRVNDRGPYSHGRIIDLSRRAAEMLDYTHSGTAEVKVEYVGRAPLEGQDDQFLMASYRPANAAPDPSDGLPDGVMIAMNGPTPGAGQPATPFPGELTSSGAAADMTTSVSFEAAPVAATALPDLGPIAPERPALDVMPGEILVASATMSYAGQSMSRAADAFAALDGAPSSADIIASWKRQGGQATAGGSFVALGSFAGGETVEAVARALAPYGRVERERVEFAGAARVSLNLYPNAAASVDDLLEAAWVNGAPDAFLVRN